MFALVESRQTPCPAWVSAISTELRGVWHVLRGAGRAPRIRDFMTFCIWITSVDEKAFLLKRQTLFSLGSSQKTEFKARKAGSIGRSGLTLPAPILTLLRQT